LTTGQVRRYHRPGVVGQADWRGAGKFADSARVVVVDRDMDGAVVVVRADWWAAVDGDVAAAQAREVRRCLVEV